jgi:predicted metal-dependent hydrolase
VNFQTEERQAITRDILVAEVLLWAKRIGVDDRLKEIHVRPMKRKWASISTRGRLTLNSDLLSQPASFRREVIVHELVHLKLGNGRHSKLFRALVRAYMRDKGINSFK